MQVVPTDTHKLKPIWPITAAQAAQLGHPTGIAMPTNNNSGDLIITAKEKAALEEELGHSMPDMKTLHSLSPLWKWKSKDIAVLS
jgi:hypothetical protein